MIYEGDLLYLFHFPQKTTACLISFVLLFTCIRVIEDICGRQEWVVMMQLPAQWTCYLFSKVCLSSIPSNRRWYLKYLQADSLTWFVYLKFLKRASSDTKKKFYNCVGQLIICVFLQWLELHFVWKLRLLLIMLGGIGAWNNSVNSATKSCCNSKQHYSCFSSVCWLTCIALIFIRTLWEEFSRNVVEEQQTSYILGFVRFQEWFCFVFSYLSHIIMIDDWGILLRDHMYHSLRYYLL